MAPVALSMGLGACAEANARWEKETARASYSSVSLGALAAPRLRPVAPMSGLVTSRHVVFRWEGPPATVELSRTRGFEVVAHRAEGNGEAAIEKVDAGHWFWRVRDGASSSSVWRLRVLPRSSRPMRQSLVAGTDTDGNGLADVLIDYSLFLGGKPASTQVGFIVDVEGDGTRPAEPLGDLQGDGFDDWLAFDLREGCPGVVAGGVALPPKLSPQRPWAAASHVVLPGGRIDCDPSSVVRASDVDGDGYGDVVADGKLYRGGLGGLAETAAVELVGYAHFAGGGDVNGDRFADVAGLSPDGELAIFLGSAKGLSATPSQRVALQGRPSPDHVRPSVLMGDIDGDGLADVLN
jgi:hypothetical protein